ncbi:unnamed protein product [Ilex paraguariensis]|uniref:Uncharacterized protein n=1 Tax=Ilex paraguariensis TaxID=185542 RepID=A0ABC8S8J4_9AQUA
MDKGYTKESKFTMDIMGKLYNLQEFPNWDWRCKINPILFLLLVPVIALIRKCLSYLYKQTPRLFRLCPPPITLLLCINYSPLSCPARREVLVQLFSSSHQVVETGL